MSAPVSAPSTGNPPLADEALPTQEGKLSWSSRLCLKTEETVEKLKLILGGGGWAKGPEPKKDEYSTANPSRFTMTDAEEACFWKFLEEVGESLQLEDDARPRRALPLGACIQKMLDSRPVYAPSVYSRAMCKFAHYLMGPARDEFLENWDLEVEQGERDNEDDIWPADFVEPEEGSGDPLICTSDFLLALAEAIENGTHLGFVFRDDDYLQENGKPCTSYEGMIPMHARVHAILMECDKGREFNHQSPMDD